MGALEDFLNAAQGNSQGLTGGAPPPDPSQGSFPGMPSGPMPPPAGSASPSPQMPAMAPPPQLGGNQPSSAPQQPPGPQMTGIKGYLTNILYGMGEAAKKHAGLPTDQELAVQKQQMDLERQKAQSGMQLQQAQVAQLQMSPATAEEATAWGVPQGMSLTQKQRSDLATKSLINSGKTDVQSLKNQGIAAKPQDPIKQAMAEAKAASDAGDTDTYKSKLALVSKLIGASKLPPSTEIALTLKANAGDKDAQQALDVIQQKRMDLVKARGASLGQGRLWSLRNYLDPETGETTSLTGFDYLAARDRGKMYMPVGQLSQDKVIAVQQLQSEATPALKQVRDALPAFDNASDRAIFARVMHSAGSPARGDEAGWLGTVMNQAMKEGLSPDGQKLAIAEGRLAETLGRMRGVLGLQATDSAMALTMRLMPGASTPNSKYAGSQLDTLDNMIQKAVEIPAFGGKNKGGMNTTPPTPPSTSRPPLASFEKTR